MPNLNLSHSGNMQITSASILGDKLNVEYEENTSGAITGFSYNPPIGSEFVCGGTYTITAYPQFSGTVYTETFTVSGYDIEGVQRSDSSTLRQNYDTDLTHYDIELSSFGGEILSSSVTANYVEFELRIDDDDYAEVDITPAGGEEIPYPIDNITTDEPETGYVATSLTIVVEDTIVDSGRASANYSPSMSTVSLVYSSSDPEVASINSRTGEITVYSSGTVQFCVYDEISELQDCKNVAVSVSGPDTSITITSLELIVPNMVLGQGYASASYVPSDAVVDLHYTSQNPTIASIDETTGEITVNYEGVVTFCVTDTRSGLSDCKQVMVMDKQYIDSIQIVVDDEIYYSATASSIYSPSAATVNLVYYSSNPSIASIDQTTGVITAYQSGNVTFCVRDLISDLSDCKTVSVIGNAHYGDYLSLQVLDGGKLYWICSGSAPSSRTIQYSLDSGGTWESLTSKTGRTSANGIEVEAGDVVLLKGTNISYAVGIPYTSVNSLTTYGGCRINAYGNVMSLIYGDDYIGQTEFEGNCNLSGFFNGCTGLISAENLVFPATYFGAQVYGQFFQGCTSLVNPPEVLPAKELVGGTKISGSQDYYGCYYYGMFRGCTSLTSAPALPATTLAQGCYKEMFYGCTSLTTAPVLPATTLKSSTCYSYMFQGCTSLTTAPALPATTMVKGGYQYMFRNCTSLTAATLPAETLAQDCYEGMFSGCTSLQTSPDLPATTLVSNCYRNMFSRCSNLSQIKCMATNIKPGTSDYTQGWCYNVSSSGTFIKNPSVSVSTWGTGQNHIPSNWTVVDAT